MIVITQVLLFPFKTQSFSEETFAVVLGGIKEPTNSVLLDWFVAPAVLLVLGSVKCTKFRKTYHMTMEFGGGGKETFYCSELSALIVIR